MYTYQSYSTSILYMTYLSFRSGRKRFGVTSANTPILIAPYSFRKYIYKALDARSRDTFHSDVSTRQHGILYYTSNLYNVEDMRGDCRRSF